MSDTTHVTLMYPRSNPIKRIVIELMDVRASDDLTISYDFERDGWVIRRDLVRDLGGTMETVEEQVEVAFLPAFHEEAP